MIADESLIPYHQQAEDEGTYVLADRAREAARTRLEESREGPLENVDWSRWRRSIRRSYQPRRYWPAQS